MNKISKIILYVALLFSFAALSEDYVVKNVAIEATGDPISARNKALSEGERNSLKELLRGISGNDNDLSNLTDAEIAACVKDFEFLSEKMTSTSYKAVVNLTFDKNLVDKLLSPTQDHKLIIPVFVRGTQTIIWEDYNYWGIAIDKQITNLNLSEQYAMPLGELDDIEILTDEVMAKGDYQQLSPILNKYHASEAIIAIAHYFIDPKTNYPTISLNIRNISKDGQKSTDKIFPFKEGGSLHDLLAKVAEDLLGAKPVKHDNFIEAKVKVKELDDWLYIKKRLSELCGEKNLKIKELSATEVDLQINTASILGDIVRLLENAKIKVVKQGSILVLSR